MVKFKLYAPPLIKSQTFKIESINTYDYNSSSDTEFVLQGSNRTPVFMSIETDQISSELRLSVKLTRNIVKQLFDLDEFAEIFDNEQGPVVVHRIIDTDAVGSKLQKYAGWTAPLYYRQAFAVKGYYHKGDYRNKEIPQSKNNCDEFDYYCLVSNDEFHAVEIEVYDDGEEVMLTYVTDDQIIEELWPGSL